MNLPGMQEVYASSAFHVVEVVYDEVSTSEEAIKAKLEELGYLNELPLMLEPGQAFQRNQTDGFFRNTAVYENIKTTVSFQQRVRENGHSTWNCPGLGVIRPEHH